MSEELAQHGMAVSWDQGAAATLAALLSLTSDAVLVFGEDGKVLLSNDEALRLLCAPDTGLVDTDIRTLFVPPATPEAERGDVRKALPFALDGSTAITRARTNEGDPLTLKVRCEELRVLPVSYVLVCHEVNLANEPDEHERLVAELERSNRRLAGTMRIVLGTLDSLDVGTLFSRVLEEMAQTVEAWATLAYVSEGLSYRLQGSTQSLENVSVPQSLPDDSGLVALAVREGRSLALRVMRPTREQMRAGTAATRTVVNQATGETTEVPSSTVPPFASFALVPVWFGGHMISLFCVGWRHEHRLRNDDLRLLDAVAEYLSVQLAGAFAALRTQRAERLTVLGTTLREQLLTVESLDRNAVFEMFGHAAEGLEAMCISLEGNAHQRTTIAEIKGVGWQEIPLDLAGVCRTSHLPFARAVDSLEGLEEWLQSQEQPSQGVLVALGLIDEVNLGVLVLRAQDELGFDATELAFLSRLAEDVCEVAEGERRRTLDKHISQALQLGMRNELQKVEGLSAQSRYSSATEAAFVGGDFYDLIRLPERQACVIMGDVSGKGVEAASVSSAVKTALAAYSWEGLRPARMVGLLNDFLLGFSRVETFATMFVGMVDLDAGRLVYCSAGHPPALLVRARTQELVTLGVQSGVVGAFEDMPYRDGIVDVEQGDVLLLYTDGVTEARNRAGDFFGEEGLREALALEARKGFEGLCDRLLGAVDAFTDYNLEDDVALVVVRFDEVRDG